MDQSWPNRQQGGFPRDAVPVGTFRQGNSPVISGDKVQFGRLRRRTRLSEGHSSGAEEEWSSPSMEANGSYGKSPILQGMQAEGNAYNRSAFEQAESSYQRRLASNGNGPQSFSPRSPHSRSNRTFQASRSRGQDQGYPATTVKASGVPYRRYSWGRNRTSSETEQGAKGRKGPAQRKRVLSETQSRPRWDKYATSHTGNGRDGMCVFG